MRQPSGLLHQRYSGCNYVVNWKTKTPLGQVLCIPSFTVVDTVWDPREVYYTILRKDTFQIMDYFKKRYTWLLDNGVLDLLNSGSFVCWLHSHMHNFKLKATHEVIVKPHNSSLRLCHAVFPVSRSNVIPRKCEDSSFKKSWIHLYSLRTYSFNLEEYLKKAQIT